MNPLGWGDDASGKIDGYQSLYTSLYTFFVNLIIPAIISGIIIDQFGEMRQNRKEVLDDLSSSCFICNIEPEDFDSQGISYSDHIKFDHRMWTYVWFKMYLQEKDATKLNGVETSVLPRMMANDVRAFPIKRARALQVE